MATFYLLYETRAAKVPRQQPLFDELEPHPRAYKDGPIQAAPRPLVVAARPRNGSDEGARHDIAGWISGYSPYLR